MLFSIAGAWRAQIAMVCSILVFQSAAHRLKPSMLSLAKRPTMNRAWSLHHSALERLSPSYRTNAAWRRGSLSGRWAYSLIDASAAHMVDAGRTRPVGFRRPPAVLPTLTRCGLSTLHAAV